MINVKTWPNGIDREKLRPYLRSRWQGILGSLAAFLFLLIRPEIFYYLFLYAAGILYVQVFYGDKWNWLRKLLVAPFFSAAAVVLVGSFFDLARIPIGVWCIYIVWFGSLLAALFFPLRIQTADVRNYRSYLYDIGIGVIFLIGLAARVIPVWNAPAPILHDPVAHAEYAKAIIETGRVQAFYSPGLHFQIAMSTLTTQADLARNTLMLTQFFNALIVVASGLFIVEFMKRPWWAIVAAALFAVGTAPAGFYTAAGKNSLVFATGFLFVTWAAVWADLGRVRKILLCNLLLLTTILSHYPAAFICCLGLAVMFFFVQNKRQFAYLFLIGAAIGALWGVRKLPYQVERVNESQSAQVIEHESLRELLTWPRFQTEATNYLESLRSDFLVTDRHYAGILEEAGFLLLLLFGVRERKYWFFPIVFVANDFLIVPGRVFRFVSHLWIVTSTQILSTYIFDYCIISFALFVLLFEIWKNRDVRYRLVSAFLALAVVVNGAFSLASSYSEYQAKYQSVQPEDLAAFQWMSQNLNPADKILVDAGIHRSNAKIVVFAGDSGVWIPVYTNLRISADFAQAFSSQVYDTTDLSMKLAKTPNDCKKRTKLLKAGFTYYFRGSRSVFAPAREVMPSLFQLVYENGPVKIYRILPCSSETGS